MVRKYFDNNSKESRCNIINNISYNLKYVKNFIVILSVDPPKLFVMC